jgi:TonB family protein
MPMKELFAASGASIFVLSRDAELVDTVRRSGGKHYPVTDVSEWMELELAVDTQRCGIALLDADLLGANLLTRIAALERHSRRLVVLVAAQRAAAQTLMSLLSDRKIHRLLIKPPALGITRLLIESGVNRWLQLRELANAAGDTELSNLGAAPSRGPRMPVSLLMTAGAALLVGVLAVIFVPSLWRAESPEQGSPAPTAAVADTTPAPEPVAPAPDTPAADTPAAEPPRFADLIARAEQAFGAGRLASPTGDNALDYYLVILAAEPTETTARAGLGRVIDSLFMQAEEALLADRHDAAAAALEHVRRADPASSRLAFLDTQLERARVAAARPVQTPAPRQTTPAAPPPAATSPAADAPTVDVAGELLASARQKLESSDPNAAAVLAAEASRLGADRAELARLNREITATRTAQTSQRHAEWLALAASKTDSGALVAPDGDSALHYLTQLQNEAPELDGLAAGWNRWRTAVVVDVERMLATHDWTRAETTLAALQRAPQGDRAAASLRAELEYGKRQEQYLTTAAPSTELTLVERKAVVYPSDALDRGIEGWVEVEFIVDTAGRTRDLTVVAAEPRGRFDEAALTALREYRYRPFELDGRVYERRVRLRTRFALQ